MRVALTLVLLLSWIEAQSSEYDASRIRELILVTSRALLCGQRPDGLWGDPSGVVRVTTMDPPPVAGDPPRPPRAWEDQYRVFAVRQSQAAEALWLVQDQIPSAAVAASRAQDLAARALLADSANPPSLKEAIWFLRAERACAQQGDSACVPTGARAIAGKACQAVLQKYVERFSVGSVCFGLGSDTWADSVDLKQSWLAMGLGSQGFCAWWPQCPPEARVRVRVARHQNVVPCTVTDREQTIPAASPFEDGTAYAVALGSRGSDVAQETLAWLRLSCDVTAEAADPEFLLACMSVFAQRRDPGDAWWRNRRTMWTDQLLAKCQQGVTPEGATLIWRMPGTDSFEHSQALALRWCVALAGTVKPDPTNSPVMTVKQFKEGRLNPAIKRLVAAQRLDGTWESTGGDDATALACIALLSCEGDPFYPGNPYRREMKRIKGGLLASDQGRFSIRAMAQHVCALAALAAYDRDPALRERLTALNAVLHAHSLPAGGWPAEKPGKDIDWAVSGMACMAFAEVSSLDSGRVDKNIGAWWSRQQFEFLSDDPQLCWKALSGLFLNELSKDQRRRAIDLLCATYQPGGWPQKYAIARLMLHGKHVNWPWINHFIHDQTVRSTIDDQAWGLFADSIVVAMLPY